MAVYGLMGWNGPGDDLANGPYFYPHDDKRTRNAFFATTYAVMGHVAKSDGRVCEDEIAMAEQVMDRMELTTEQKKLAIKLFNHGKEDGFPLDKILARFKKDIERRALVRHFMEIQLHIAYSDGDFKECEHRLFREMVGTFEFNRLEFEHLQREIKNQLLDSNHVSLNQAYSVLGVTYEVGEEELKKVYRRLIGQYHPDRMQATHANEDEMRLASERAHQVMMAYEQIKRVRGF